MDESVFHSYECANQTRLPTKLKREINENETGLTWRLMAEKRCPAFCNWIYDFETVCRILLKKNPQIANLVFYLWIFFQPPVSITALATAKKLSMGPYGKEPMSQFFRWVL